LAAVRECLGVGVLPAAMAPKELVIVNQGMPGLSDTEIALVSARGAGAPSRLLGQEVLRSFQKN